MRDFLSYLETFTWNVKRAEQGYDLIFIDELHLFTEQERLAFNSLTRSAEEYPRLFMALDPRQAPYEAYAGYSDVQITQRESGQVEERLGYVGSVDLATIYRFSPQILKLVRHIHRSYPTLELGPDWEDLDIEGIQSAQPNGDRPILHRHRDQESEISEVFRRAQEMLRNSSRDDRVAVVLLDSLSLKPFSERVDDASGLNVSVIQSRDDVENLRYSRRNVVLSAAEYLAGLQFSHVIVAGFPESETGMSHVGHQLRRFLSLFYLAVSRASRTVEIHTNDGAGELPPVLDGALRNGVIRSAA